MFSTLRSQSFTFQHVIKIKQIRQATTNPDLKTLHQTARRAEIDFAKAMHDVLRTGNTDGINKATSSVEATIRKAQDYLLILKQTNSNSK